MKLAMWHRPVARLLLTLILSTALIAFLVLQYHLYASDLRKTPRHGDVEVGAWRFEDLEDTADEKYCRAPHDLRPSLKPFANIAHFVILSPIGSRSEVSFVMYLSVKSAILRLNANEIKIHTYGLNTENHWWRQLKPHVTLVEIDRETVKTPHGMALGDLQLAHQSDVIRLEIMQTEGGIYLDTDMFVLKPFTDLLNNPRDIILGHEGGDRYGLGNAVIIARPQSEFLKIWQDSYTTFDPQKWNEHSVLIPKRLQVEYPDLVCALAPSVWFWPTWAERHVRYMHEHITTKETLELEANMQAFDGAMYENQLAVHGWGARQNLERLGPESMDERNTRFKILLHDIHATPLS